MLDITRTAWRDTINAAQIFNDPGHFTTFVAYEYTTSSDDQGNLHRNVIFKGAERIPAIPFSRFHSQNPEDLWKWMDELRAQGIESLAIPHNSNGSNGQMFKLVDWAGDPIDNAYAEQRIRNEPLVEITQIKGTSETHPILSPRDEWARLRDHVRSCSDDAAERARRELRARCSASRAGTRVPGHREPVRPRLRGFERHAQRRRVLRRVDLCLESRSSFERSQAAGLRAAVFARGIGRRYCCTTGE